MSFLIFAFSPLSLYSPSVSIPYDSTNWRHLWIKIGIPVLVSCCSDRGIPDTWVCLRADIHDSASAGFSAFRWYVLCACDNIAGKGHQASISYSVMVVNRTCLPVWYNYLYAALLFICPGRVWALEVSHFTKVNLVYLFSLLKYHGRRVLHHADKYVLHVQCTCIFFIVKQGLHFFQGL